MMELSPHAQERWDERFPTHNLHTELSNLFRLRSRFARVLRQRHEDLSGCNNRREYWYSYSGIIFITAGNVIVTVIQASVEVMGLIERYIAAKAVKEHEHNCSKFNTVMKKQKKLMSTRKKHCNRTLLNKYTF